MINPRKVVGTKHYFTTEINKFDKSLFKVVSQPEYTTDGENLILIKGVETCTLTLDNKKNDYIVVKTLTKVVINTTENLIDEEYDEVVLDKGACIEFLLIENNWYILSSDGIKLN